MNDLDTKTSMRLADCDCQRRVGPAALRRAGPPLVRRNGGPALEASLSQPRKSEILRLGLLRLILLCVCGLGGSHAVHAQTGDGALIKYQEMPLPSAEDMLRGKPFDWIVLKTEEVLVTEPLAPRPDPVGRLNLKLKQAEARYNRILKYKPAKLAEVERQFNRNRNLKVDELRAAIDTPLNAARDRIQEAKLAAQKIAITLLGTDVDPDYLLETRHIQLVVHYEDLLLRRIDQLIDEGRVPLAYDLLLLVDRRHRDNNARIQAELEADEKSLLAEIESLKGQREVLRGERDQLKSANKRTVEIDNSIDSLTNEMKELDEEVLSLRKKLRFARPKDFPRPDAPQKDDILLPAWPRFEELHAKLVFKDSEQLAGRGDLAGGLRLLEELWKPDQSIDGLSTRMGDLVDRLMTALVKQRDYRQGRHFLNRLATREPGHVIVEKWRTDLTEQAVAAIAEARTLAARGDALSAVEAIEHAARIWPEASGLREAHRELTDKYQRVRMGVMELPQASPGRPFESDADERARLLTTAALFEPTRIDDQGVRYRSSFFESWEPTDLGRQVRFTLKLRRADWESRALITAADVHAEVAARLDPTRPEFDERLAGFVNGLTVQSPSEFTVHFQRLPLRLESLFGLSVGLQPESRSLNEDLIGESSVAAGRQRFDRTARDERQVVFRRVRPQPATSRQRHVDEVVEVRYDSWEKGLQGLLRGEVTALDRADLRDVKALQDDGRFFVIPHALPRSHFLMFHPGTKALRDGQLRRAILHALPRDQLLKDLVLAGAPPAHARLITGPFATKGYGNNRLLVPPAYDAPLAAALALTAKKQLGGALPALRLVCPPDSRVREAARAMIGHWRRVGLDVTLLESGPVAANENDAGWDICYRTARFVEPIADIWPLLTLQDTARVEALQPLPERTRRSLLELEQTIDWTTATSLLHRLLSDLQTEARCIPLWEVDEFLVVRRNLIGVPPRPMHTYDDIERWTLQSWYPMETP